jgi:hypothetical protein
LYHYGRNPSVWHDEAALIVNVLGKSFWDLLGPLFFAEAAPPLFLWIEKAVALSLGEATYALRLVPLLASCASLLLMVPVARRVLSAQAVPWAILLFATSDHLLWHTCEAKPYAVDVLAAVVSIAAYSLTQSWPLRRRLWLCGLLALCLIFVSYPGCFLCGGLLTALLPVIWHARRMAARVGYILFACAVFGAFALVLAGPAYAQRCPAMAQCWIGGFPVWNRPWSVPLWTLLQTLEVFRYCCEPLGQVYAALAVIGVIGLWRRGERAYTVLLVLPLVLAVLASYLGAYPYGGYRVMVYATPALVLLIGEGVAPVLDRLWTPREAMSKLAKRVTAFPRALSLAWSPVVAMFVVLLLLPVGRAVKRVLFPWPRADCAAAAAYVKARLQPGDQVAANHWEYAYYFRRLGSTFTLLDQSPRRFGPRLWLVVTAPESADRLAVARSLPPGDWSSLEQQDFMWTSVLLLSREGRAEHTASDHRDLHATAGWPKRAAEIFISNNPCLEVRIDVKRPREGLPGPHPK